MAAPASEHGAGDADQLRYAQRAADLVASPEYEALRAALETTPGFLALAPSMAEEPVVTAVYSGPAPTLPVAPALDGWRFETLGHATPETLRAPVADVEDLSQDDAAPVPSSSTGIGPGSPLLISIPDEGTFICSANFVFQDGSQFYLGTAGHCLLGEDATATHGPGADYDANGVTVEVCVASCHFGGFLTGFLGDMRDLGDVAYARQTASGEDIGNDFGVVAIPSSLEADIRPEMPVWLGPTGERSAEGFGTPLVHYGNGIDAGTVFATKGRAGTSLNDGESASWQANVLINGGDSGSAVNHADAVLTADVVRGTDALGLVTHGLIIPGVPLGWGTTVGQAKTMATEANLNLALVLEGGGSSGGGGSGGGGSGFTLSAEGYKVRGVQHADLTWSGATGTDVDVYRDGALIVTTPNDGEHTDNIGQRGSGSYTYQVCEAGTDLCSNEATVTF